MMSNSENLMTLTVTEMIAQVCDRYDRPDIDDKVLKQFQAVLRQAHTTDMYTKDLYTQYSPAPFISGNKASIITADFAKGIRKIHTISTYSSYTGVGSEAFPYIPGTLIQDEFKDVSVDFNKTDYYGFAYEQTWAHLGRNITLNGIDASTTLVGIEGFCWPSFTLNIITEEYETDSWILEEYDEYIDALVAVRACTIIQNMEALTIAKSRAVEVRAEFIKAFAEYTTCL